MNRQEKRDVRYTGDLGTLWEGGEAHTRVVPKLDPPKAYLMRSTLANSAFCISNASMILLSDFDAGPMFHPRPANGATPTPPAANMMPLDHDSSLTVIELST